MEFPHLHDWTLSTTEARDLQLRLAGQVDRTSRLGRYRLVAAADASYSRGATVLFGVVVVLDAHDGMKEVERVGAQAPMSFPYVPGLLTFREAPPLLEAFRRLKTRPDVVLCDGQGFAHPRRLGVASHLGLWLGIPTIGCAKSRLCGTFEEPGAERGSTSPLWDDVEQIGTVLRTRSRVKPLFVSAGHKIRLEDAVRVVLETSPRHRLPEPARRAHVAVNELRRSVQGP